MFQRLVLTVAVVLVMSSVAFAQATAVPPALGYAESFQINYVSNMQAGGTYVNLVNAGSHGGGPEGTICVNVYTYDPDEQPRNCCTCPVTPNAVRSLSAADLSIPLFPGPPPTSVTVKLLATRPPTGAGCNASVAPTGAPGSPGSYAAGMRAWATHVHLGPVPGGTYITENDFSHVPLSTSELDKVTAVCKFIQTYGSGNGICRACALGARGPIQ